MAKSSRLSKEQSNALALNRAIEFSEYNKIFAKYKNRKKLKSWEKAQITRKTNQLFKIAEDAGGLGYLTVIPEKTLKKIRKNGFENQLIGDFNIVKLNKYNDGKTLDINDFGDLVEKRKYEKAGRDDLSKGRNFTFVRVNCNFAFGTGRYDDSIESGEIYDRVKELILRRYWQTYNSRKNKMPKKCEFYLWGSQGVMYKRASSSFALLMRFLDEWVDLYLDRIIDARGALSDELQGWCYHANIQLKPKAKKVRGKNGKTKNSRSRR